MVEMIGRRPELRVFALAARRLAPLVVAALLGAHAAIAGEPGVFHREGVLGTSLDVTVHGAEPGDAAAAFDALLAEARRLESILSGYRPDSELSALNRARAASALSPELAEVLRLCEEWRARSEERFSCRMGQVIDLWRAAEREQRVPDRVRVRTLAWGLNRAELDVEQDMEGGSLALPEGLSIAPDGVAKGYIIDRLAVLLRARLPGAAFKLDIGGDALYQGEPPGRDGWEVAVANPVASADNGDFAARLRLDSRAIAASGHHSRERRIGHRAFSHILQPRDGWPVAAAPAAVVVAADAATADAVATALAAGDLSGGVDWVDTLPGVEALLIAPNGRQLASAGWNALLAPGEPARGVALRLNYAIPDPGVAGYHRPYLAIWISDSEREPVRNLLLLGETPRWARENRNWWRRVGRESPQLLDGVARPTRRPGDYSLVWDGRDDFGRPLPAGDYSLHVEASREGGDASYRRIPFTLGGGTLEETFDAEGELGRIRLRVPGGR